MRIGELSRRAGVNIQTVRFYERQKLLREPSRTAAGYRSYVEADLERIIFIKQSQQLGFSLHEIKELIEIHDPEKPASHGRARDSDWKRAMRIAEERLRHIDEKIRFLKNFRAQLAAILKDGYSRFCAAPELRPAQPGRRTLPSCPASEQVRKQRTKRP